MPFTWWLGVALAEEPVGPVGEEVSTPAASPAPEGPATPDDAVKAAMAHVQEGDVDRALAVLQDATHRWPDAGDPWVLLASYQLASGRLDGLGATLAAAPAAHRDALAPHRLIGALVARTSEGLPPGHPLLAVVLDAELAAFDARGGHDAEFADLVRLVEVVILQSRGDTGPEVAAELVSRAVALVDRPGGASRASMEAGAAALTMVDAWTEAIDAVGRAAKSGADPAAAALLVARMHVLWGLRDDDRRRLEKGRKLLAKIDEVKEVSAAALAAERFAVDLALRPLPTGAEGRATEARVREVLGALDPSVPADLPWAQALSTTLASVATSNGEGDAALVALRGVDLDRSDPVTGVVTALALAERGTVVLAEVLPELAQSEDTETKALAEAWLAAAPGADAHSWVPVATGAANVGLGIDAEGPHLAVTMTPTLVMVLSPEE
jgi:hypothetical protein